LAAERVHSFKKAEMAETAEDLLIGTSWLPKPLRTPGQTFAAGIEPVSLADDDAAGQSANPSIALNGRGTPSSRALAVNRSRRKWSRSDPSLSRTDCKCND